MNFKGIKKENKYLDVLRGKLEYRGFKNFKQLLNKIKNAEFSYQKDKGHKLLKFSQKREEKNRIKEVDVIILL